MEAHQEREALAAVELPEQLTLLVPQASRQANTAALAAEEAEAIQRGPVPVGMAVLLEAAEAAEAAAPQLAAQAELAAEARSGYGQ